MRMKAAPVPAALLVLCAIASFSESEYANPDTQAECQKYLKTSLPADAPHMPVPAKFPECGSLSLYYGKWDSVPDFKAAADCAWQERAYLLSDRGRAPVDPNTPISLDQIEGGSLTLAMIYANGLGITRNVPVALRFVCEAENTGAVIDDALEGLKQEASTPAPVAIKDYFTMCTYQGGTPDADICAEWDEQVKNADRRRQIGEIVNSWNSEEQRAAFKQLEAAADKYFRSHASGELNRAGTIRGIHAMEEVGDFRDEFVRNLQQLSKGSVQRSTNTDVLDADHDLNLTYRKLTAQAKAHETEYGAVQPADIQSTQRAWIEYRDRWLAFAALVRPDTNADTWLTWLTKRRIEVLNNTADEVGNGFE